MEREKGAVSASCDNCGTQVDMQAQADGSLAADPCPSCYGETAVAGQALPEVSPSSYGSDSQALSVAGDEEQDDEG